jgi:3',5'-cyclic AMP phosphodiesterase CpdA
MPITLPPLSRRRFLAGALAAGAGAILPRTLWAEDKPADPNHWVWLSDTHIWEERDKAHRATKPALNFGIVRRGILALPSRPAGAIVTGDCAYMVGEPGDYMVLAEEVKPLREAGIPLHFAFGNHDERNNFPAAFAEVRQEKPPVADKCVAVVETPHANLVLLDSLVKTKYTPGELGKPQLAWLAKTLDARADKPAIVMAHHDPDNGLGSGLLDTKALFDVLLPRKHVKAYVFGHTHRWQVSKKDDLHLVNLPPTAWVFAAGMPQGWVEVTLAAGGATLVLHCLDPKHAKDGEKVELKWRA